MSFQNQNQNQPNMNMMNEIILLLQNIYNNNHQQIQILQNSNNLLMNTLVRLVNNNVANQNNVNNNNNVNHNNVNNTNRANYAYPSTPLYFNNMRNRQNRQNNNPQNTTPTAPSAPSTTQTQYTSTANLLRNLLNNDQITYTTTGGYETYLLDLFFNPITQPVTIYPTQNQIESATRRMRYSDVPQNANNQVCPISLERFNQDDDVLMIRHCGHIFNPNELNRWFRSHCTCPVCRYDIRDYNPANDSPYTNANNNVNNNVNNTNISQNQNTRNQMNEETESDDNSYSSEDNNNNNNNTNNNVRSRRQYNRTHTQQRNTLTP